MVKQCCLVSYICLELKDINGIHVPCDEVTEWKTQSKKHFLQNKRCEFTAGSDGPEAEECVNGRINK